MTQWQEEALYLLQVEGADARLHASLPNLHDCGDQTFMGPLRVCTVREKKMFVSIVAVFHSHSVYRCLSLLCAQGGEPDGKKRESPNWKSRSGRVGSRRGMNEKGKWMSALW